MTSLNHPVVSVCCPMRDESEMLAPFFERLLPILEGLGLSYEIVCVNDGSRDDTWNRLLEYQSSLPSIRIVDLSRGFGKEAALTCAIDQARGDAVIPIDADLQDPPELIVEMVRLWQQGFEVVLPQRTDRQTDSWMKRQTAHWFYRMHNAISDSEIPSNVGDFRLMDRRVVAALQRLPERRRFMKGLFAWVGFRQAILPYARAPRVAGTTKFSGWRLWNLALEGLTSFSTAPLRIWTYIGFFIAFSSFGFGLFIIGRVLLFGRDLPGYASLATMISFLGGVQLMGLGVMGEYLGRLYQESKGRPIYIIRESKGDESGNL